MPKIFSKLRNTVNSLLRAFICSLTRDVRRDLLDVHLFCVLQYTTSINVDIQMYCFNLFLSFPLKKQAYNLCMFRCNKHNVVLIFARLTELRVVVGGLYTFFLSLYKIFERSDGGAKRQHYDDPLVGFTIYK